MEIYNELAVKIVSLSASVLVIAAALFIAIFLLYGLIVVGCLAAGIIVRVVFFPVHAFLSAYPRSEWATHVAQALVAVIFLCFFTSRLTPQYRIFAFFFLLALILLLVWMVLRIRARYRPYFTEVLFDERYVHPVWDWISSQRRILALMSRIPPLRPVGAALDLVASRVHHRRWQLFLSSLLVFSFYTLPVQLAPSLDNLISDWTAVVIKHYDLEWLMHSALWGNAFKATGTIYLYLFDWLVTVIALYGLITILCPLEPRNIFGSVDEALRDFVSGRGTFIFSGLFWQYGDGTSDPVVCSKGETEKRFFTSIAKSVHKESVNLDADLRGAWQGENARIAFACTIASPDGKGPTDYCVHYRRLGRSSYLVAVDAKATCFNGSNAKSQTSLQELSDSIGYLVNVRDSLK
jgi:hypothetical protein